MASTRDELREHPMDRASEKGRVDFNRAALPAWPPDRPGGPVSAKELTDLEQGKAHAPKEQQQLNHPRPTWAPEKNKETVRTEYDRTKRAEFVREGLKRIEGIPKTHFRNAAKDRGR